MIHNKETNNSNKNSFLAFLDTLGFKSLVENNEHRIVAGIYDKLLLFVDKFNEQISQNENRKVEFFKGKNDYLPVKMDLFAISDSLILLAKAEDEGWAIKEFFSAVRELMIYSFILGIPLRGSITRKSVSLFRHNGSLSIVGKGLTDAYQLESKQNWAGCIVEKEVFESLSKENQECQFVKADLSIKLVRSEVPIKGGKEFYECINWATHKSITEKIIIDSFGKYNKRMNETEKIRNSIDVKINNTLDFYRKNK